MRQEQVKIKGETYLLVSDYKEIVGYTTEPCHEEDTTLFINNREIKEQFSKKNLRFPSLSHT